MPPAFRSPCRGMATSLFLSPRGRGSTRFNPTGIESTRAAHRDQSLQKCAAFSAGLGGAPTLYVGFPRDL